MMNSWRECKLGDVANINPTESLKKGTVAKKVPMDALQPFTKKIPRFDIEQYNGGVKFKNGDTLVARITPSLENGKTSFVDILDEDEIGFGSTEFIVLREKDGESDKHFLYYLSMSPEFREVAIKSMTGSSGRQRVQNEVVFEHEFLIPPLEEQKAIAEVLSSLDDKIDLLHRQNQTLESLAQTLFRQWFENSDFDGIVGDISYIQNGYAFKSKDFQDFGSNGVLKIKNISNSIINILNTDFIDESVANKTDLKFQVSSGDILFGMTGAEIGKMGIVPQTNKKLWLNQRVGMLKEKYNGSKYLAYLQLTSEFGYDYIVNTATGSAQPNISGSDIEQCPFVKLEKDEIETYSSQLRPLFEKIVFNLGQIQTLENLRDTLLPKLLSGELVVSE